MKSLDAALRNPRRRNWAFTALVSLFSIFLLADASSVHAQDVANLYSIEGKAEGLFPGQSGWTAVSQGQKFTQKDAIRTLEQSRAGVRFTTGYLIRMNERTTIQFNQTGAQPKSGRMSVIEGVGHFFSRTAAEFPTVNTPHVSASVRGTEFVVAVNKDSTLISVLDGAVDAENQYGAVSLGKGEQALTKAGSAPVKQIIVRQNDAVQWALYYPAALELSDLADFQSTATAEQRNGISAIQDGRFGEAEAAFAGTSWQSVAGRSVLAYRRGDSSAALKELRSYHGERTSGLLALESSLQLASGQVERARALLAQADSAVATAPPASRDNLRAYILSQQAVIAVTVGETARAEKFALQAEQLAPSSASSSLALAFVRQSQFRLEESRALLEETVRRQPENAVARARLAELLLGFGEREQALEQATAALERDPNNAYALAVLGFAELTLYNTENATAYFQRSSAADSGFGLPLLGMGLAKIRQGDLEAGRELIEKAVLLDPTVSLYRSYLGKAYYEGEQDGRAEHEYQRAIDLDPLDPTPHLYRSYSLLSGHRPIEALESLQESVDKNDNRAVYRSRLLLDQDQGTRSSGLGQIYSRLDFTELARVEALRSLNRDYSNYSAHFLLADLYRDTHLNSRAQVTENLLGRMLSPVNFNANDINIGGEASLNEYNSLFDRPTERARVVGFGRTQTEAFGARTD